MRRIRTVVACSLTGLVLTGAVSAGEGAIEINQTRALAGGPGDPPGFPVVISEPGRYQLTSNLDLRVATDPANTDAVRIDVDNVTLDLKGFRIVGGADCSGLPSADCTGTGGGDGIDASDRNGIVVRNGTIRSMGRHGVALAAGRGGRVEEVRLISNGGLGVSGVGSASIVGCLALQNGLGGITNGRGRVDENLVARSGEVGITSAGIVTRNLVAENLDAGLLGSAAYAENFFYINNAGGAQVVSPGPQTAPNACSFSAGCP